MLGRKNAIAFVLLLTAVTPTGCSDDGDGGCDDGDERCDGNTVMQCNSGEWTVKKNCEDTGRTCSKVSGDDADCQ